MEVSEKNQIERLVSAICDEGATQERLAALEALLLDRPDLQDEYSRLARVNFMLSHEFKLSRIASNTSKLSLHSVLAAQDPGAVTAKNVSAATSGSTSRRNAVSRRRMTQIAAALAIGAAASLVIWAKSKPVRPVDLLDAGFQTAFDDEGMVIRDYQVLLELQRLNRTEKLASVTLPLIASESSPQVTLCSGAAWMDYYSPNNRERGYLLSLPPKVKIDVLIDANAICHNSLSVVELKNAGQMTGRTLSFTNLIDGNGESLENFADTVGEFSEFNDGLENKFYLLTGTHKLVSAAEDAPWRASDFRVHFSNSNVLVLGWDDSGHVASKKVVPGNGLPAGGDPDRDFDDMRAVIHFSGPGIKKPEQTLSFEPPVRQEKSLADLHGDEFLLDVRPGEETLLLLSSDASLANTLQVVDAKTSQILWRYESGDPTLVSPAEETVYQIRNHGKTVQRFALQGKFQIQEDGQWEKSLHRVVIDNERTTVVGFEDNILGEEIPDWNDIRVDIHRSGPEIRRTDF